MQKKTVIFGSLAVLVAAGLLLVFWRSQIMGPDAHRVAGGLIAVDAKGTPVPLPPSESSQAGLDDNVAFQQAGDLLVSLMLDPYPPTMANAGNFEVVLADTAGRLINNAQIAIDLTMPGMYMPPNKLDLQQAEAGTYRAEGRFTMRGLWRMEVIITLDGQSRSVFFDVWL